MSPLYILISPSWCPRYPSAPPSPNPPSQCLPSHFSHPSVPLISMSPSSQYPYPGIPHPTVPPLCNPIPVSPSSCYPHYLPMPHLSVPILVSPHGLGHAAMALQCQCCLGGEGGGIWGPRWGSMGGDGAPRSSLGCISFGGLSIQAGHWGGVSVPLSERSSAIGTMGTGCGGSHPAGPSPPVLADGDRQAAERHLCAAHPVPIAGGGCPHTGGG